MLVEQKLQLGFILIPGIVLGVTLVLMRARSGRSLILWGGVLAFTSILASVFLMQKTFSDVFLLLDSAGFGKGYTAGSLLMIAGVIVEAAQIVKKR